MDAVNRGKESGHVVTFSHEGKTKLWECDAIAICSGLHTDPYIPTFPGIEHVPRVFHSSEFRLRKDFGVDKHVMILGAGETAMDLGYLAVTSSTKSVTISHRDGFYYAPKVCFIKSDLKVLLIVYLDCSRPYHIQNFQQISFCAAKHPNRYFSHEFV